MRNAIALCLIVFMLASCTGSVPAELGLKKTNDIFTVYYPQGWKAVDGLGGGVNLENANGTMLIPIGVTPDPRSKANDVNSIPEILSAFQKPVPGGSMKIARLSGYRCIRAEADVVGQKLLIVYVPLDGKILSIQMQPRRAGGQEVSASDMQLGAMVVENLEIK
jgi:hypothetical protein